MTNNWLPYLPQLLVLGQICFSTAMTPLFERRIRKLVDDIQFKGRTNDNARFIKSKILNVAQSWQIKMELCQALVAAVFSVGLVFSKSENYWGFAVTAGVMVILYTVPLVWLMSMTADNPSASTMWVWAWRLPCGGRIRLRISPARVSRAALLIGVCILIFATAVSNTGESELQPPKEITSDHGPQVEHALPRGS